MKNSLKIVLVLMLTVIFFVGATQVNAAFLPIDPITLTDKNSPATIDLGSVYGMYDWIVDGKDYLHYPDGTKDPDPVYTGQWFWYRVGDSGPELPINTLDYTYKVSDADFDDGFETLVVKYTDNASLVIDITYTLEGGLPSSNTADIAETIAINNTSGSAMDFHFFQYTDFDIDQQNDIASHMSETQFIQTSSSLGVAFSETIATSPDHWEIDTYKNIWVSLQDGEATTLGDVDNSTPPEDVCFAWEWDYTIPKDGTLLISKDKRIAPVPLPSALILLSSGLLGLVGIRRKKLF